MSLAEEGQSLLHLSKAATSKEDGLPGQDQKCSYSINIWKTGHRILALGSTEVCVPCSDNSQAQSSSTQHSWGSILISHVIGNEIQHDIICHWHIQEEVAYAT